MNKEALNAKHLCLLVFTILYILPFLIFVIPHDKREMACGSVEWEFQEAFGCLANPQMWKRWSEISYIYGSSPENSRGEIGCPIYIQRIEKYNLTSEDRGLFTHLAHTNKDAGIKQRFKELKKRDFCESADERGWIDIYLKRGP